MADIPTPAQVALVRRRYLEQATLQSIRRESGLSSRQVYRCLDGHNDDGSGTSLEPLARRRAAVPAARGAQPGQPGDRRELVARLWRSAECQVEDIEQRLRAAGLEVAEREGNARAFAILVKTVRELAAFDAAQKPSAQKEVEDDDDDAVPRDLDEFRKELARRIDALVARKRDNGDAGGP